MPSFSLEAVLLGGCTTYTTHGYGSRVYSDGYDSGNYYSRGYHNGHYYGGGNGGGYYDERRYGYNEREVHNNVAVVHERNATDSHRTTSATSATVSHAHSGHSTQASRLSSPPKPHADSNKTAAASHGVGKHPHSGKTEEPKKQ
jgi:hypothetical protein